MQDAEVALPDRGDAVEDRHEQHALRQDTGGEEIEVVQPTRWSGHANAP